MTWCTRVRITKMHTDGAVLGLKLLDMGPVEDGHEFGLRQETELITSPVTGLSFAVYYPVLHMRGRKAFPYETEDER